MRINPCHGCPFKTDCPKVEALRASVKGSGARSVSFWCDRIPELLPVGTRITMSMAYKDEDGDGYGPRICRAAMPATVVDVTRDGKFRAVMDKDEDIDNDKYRWRKKKHVSRIVKVLPEERREVCGSGFVINETGECDRYPDTPCLCAEQRQYQRLFSETRGTRP